MKPGPSFKQLRDERGIAPPTAEQRAANAAELERIADERIEEALRGDRRDGLDLSDLFHQRSSAPPETDETMPPPAAEATNVSDLDDFLDEDEPEHDYIVPEVLERRDRVILTGPEGGGKSTLMRQFAVQAGAGIHPFTLEDVPPVRVLLVDLENSRRHVRRKFRPLRLSAGARLERGNVIPIIRPAGIDLLLPEDRDWLRHQVECSAPDLLILGPSYNSRPATRLARKSPDASRSHWTRSAKSSTSRS